MTLQCQKALSIRQPWAWLITHGYKDVENRTWNTRFRGLCYIHASRMLDVKGLEYLKVMHPEIPLPEPCEYQLGGIIGEVELTHVIRPGEPPQSDWHEEGLYGFYLRSPRPLPLRPLRGRQGFFNINLESAK